MAFAQLAVFWSSSARHRVCCLNVQWTSVCVCCGNCGRVTHDCGFHHRWPESHITFTAKAQTQTHTGPRWAEDPPPKSTSGEIHTGNVESCFPKTRPLFHSLSHTAHAHRHTVSLSGIYTQTSKFTTHRHTWTHSQISCVFLQACICFLKAIIASVLLGCPCADVQERVIMQKKVRGNFL